MWGCPGRRSRPEQLDLDPKQKAGKLSGGQRAQLALTIAVAKRPELLLLDEPVAGMNEVESAALGEIFAGLARDGMGLLLIEHNIGFVTRLCQHIYVLDSGRLIAEGAPGRVVSDPAVITAYLGVDDDA